MDFDESGNSAPRIPSIMQRQDDAHTESSYYLKRVAIRISSQNTILMHIHCTGSCRSYQRYTIALETLSFEAVNVNDMAALVQGRVSRGVSRANIHLRFAAVLDMIMSCSLVPEPSRSPAEMKPEIMIMARNCSLPTRCPLQNPSFPLFYLNYLI